MIHDLTEEQFVRFPTVMKRTCGFALELRRNAFSVFYSIDGQEVWNKTDCAPGPNKIFDFSRPSLSSLAKGNHSVEFRFGSLDSQLKIVV
jgi:hypothetical protein